MQKIIALLIISLFVVSCTNSSEIDNEKTNNMSGTINNDNSVINDMTGILDNKIDFTEDLTGNTDETDEIDETKIKDTNNINNIEKDSVTPTGVPSTNSTSSPDEAALENEVNDLLDEFIDSLDSYDK